MKKHSPPCLVSWYLFSCLGKESVMAFLGVNKVLNLNGMMRDVTEGIQELSVL